MRDKAAKATYDSIYYRSNKERILTRKKALKQEQGQAFRDRENARDRFRRANDPDYRKRKKAAYDRAKWVFDEDFTYQHLLDIRSQECFYCGGPGGSADHLVPRSRGGLDRLDNLVPACLACNKAKNTKSVDVFYLLKRVG